MIPIPLIAFPIALLAALLLSGGVGFWGYEHGIAIQEARQTKQELADERAEKARNKERQKDGTVAAKEHDDHEDEINRLYALLRSRPGAVPIPPATDPFVPVWYVRMHDRAASGWVDGDPYPGKSDGDASEIRLSQALAMLITNYEGCQVNRSRLIDIKHLEPVLPALPPPTEQPKPGLFSRINPFN